MDVYIVVGTGKKGKSSVIRSFACCFSTNCSPEKEIVCRTKAYLEGKKRLTDILYKSKSLQEDDISPFSFMLITSLIKVSAVVIALRTSKMGKNSLPDAKTYIDCFANNGCNIKKVAELGNKNLENYCTEKGYEYKPFKSIKGPTDKSCIDVRDFFEIKK